MFFIKNTFGKELKEMVVKRENVAAIRAWAHDTYYERIFEIDSNSNCVFNEKTSFRRFLLQLGTMEVGPEFEYSYEELDGIADRLIAGEDVEL